MNKVESKSTSTDGKGWVHKQRMHLYASAPILVRPLHTLCTHTEWGGGNIVSARYLGYAGQYNEVVIAVESKNFFWSKKV